MLGEKSGDCRISGVLFLSSKPCIVDDEFRWYPRMYKPSVKMKCRMHWSFTYFHFVSKFFSCHAAITIRRKVVVAVRRKNSLYHSFSHGIIAKGLLNLLDCLNRSITKLLTKRDAISTRRDQSSCVKMKIWRSGTITSLL